MDEEILPFNFKVLPMMQPGGGMIDIEEIKRLSRAGFSDSPPEDRAMAWLTLLEVYPQDPNQWREIEEKLLSTYFTYVEMLQMEDWEKNHLAKNTNFEDFNTRDPDLLKQIHGDIIRTTTHLRNLPLAPIEGEYPEEEIVYSRERHVRRIERILFVLGSVITGLGYMQGFNELVLQLYCIILRASIIFRDEFEVETLTFYSLHNLLSMTNLKDLFTTHDRSSIIVARMSMLSNLLMKHAPHKALAIQNSNIEPVVYGYRWVSLLYCQKYRGEDLFTIWDALLSHIDNLLDFAFYIAVVIIDGSPSVKKYEMDYQLMDALQEAHIPNVHMLLGRAQYLWRVDHEQHNSFKLFHFH